MASSGPRRSPRLAEMAVTRPTVVPVPVTAPAAAPPVRKIGRSKKALLAAAEELRLACINATTKEDWAACREFAHKLDDAADAANVGESIFITDCAYWCSCEDKECNSYAVTAIESYIETLA